MNSARGPRSDGSLAAYATIPPRLVDPARQLGDEARLADAVAPRNGDEAALAVTRLLPGPLQHRELGVATGENRGAGIELGRQAETRHRVL